MRGSNRSDVEYQPRKLFVHGDSVRLHQILVNLLSNAAKYSDPGTTVSAQRGQKSAAKR